MVTCYNVWTGTVLNTGVKCSTCHDHCFLCKISNVKIVTTQKDALKQSLRRSQYMHFLSLSLRVILNKDNNGFKLVRYLSGNGCYSLYSNEYRGRLLHNIPFFNCHVQPLAKYAICWGRPVFGRSRRKSRGSCIETTKRLITKSVKDKIIL